MSRLILVRHGQASFFSDNYDKLSPLGEVQARKLAEYWLDREVRIDGAFCGTLERQRRTGEVVKATYEAAGEAFPELEVLPGLDEYPADDIMGILLPELCEKDERIRALRDANDAAEDDRERYKAFHRLLEAVFTAWVAGSYESTGFQTWVEFRDTVLSAFETIKGRDGRGLNLAVFASGGTIGVKVQTVLEAPDIKAGELNWRINNCSLTEFTFSDRRITLDVFNAVPHLTDPDLLTYR